MCAIPRRTPFLPYFTFKNSHYASLGRANANRDCLSPKLLMSFYERGDDRGFQNSQRMENIWAVEIIALRLRPTRSLFDGSVLSSLPAANGQLLSMSLIQCCRLISG